jgi:hypothetical protein
MIVQLAALCALFICACGSTAGTTRGKTEAAPGFFDRLTDAITERECDVVRFTCPYGWGPAGEPCECIDPKGVVLSGRTIK